MSRKLQCAVRTVPPVPSKLMFAFLHPTLRTGLHTTCVGKISLNVKHKELFSILMQLNEILVNEIFK